MVFEQVNVWTALTSIHIVAICARDILATFIHESKHITRRAVYKYMCLYKKTNLHTSYLSSKIHFQYKFFMYKGQNIDDMNESFRECTIGLVLFHYNSDITPCPFFPNSF
ncbi:hypothetical protein ACJX0J_020020 [Zea mays]